MELDKILNDDLILLDVDCENKNDILKIMSKKLLEHNFINDQEKFLEDVYNREKLGETGIGNYIAIPHGQSDSVIQTTICIAKLKNEIEWESLDGNGVKVVILFVVENNEDFANSHLKLLTNVARKLSNSSTLENLLSANSKSDIKKCFI